MILDGALAALAGVKSSGFEFSFYSPTIQNRGDALSLFGKSLAEQISHTLAFSRTQPPSARMGHFKDRLLSSSKIKEPQGAQGSMF